ncbi:YceI family protein [Acetobacter farinalis]|uniref:YceI family protein n=1 Tax=Acetobacter farinalis TaxID=1260984 RepID=A0ABT3QAB9_9PROT|nr:YceI family protein [Acetobacter farinalis]MCX2562184.1 YceI family protein [Acetobacter farinalis]NHO30798.1 polyisoprenoid-binding protein [Acetobacter farinalis]
MKITTLSLSAAALTLGLLTGNPASAQVVTTAALSQSGTYDVEPGHTQVGFSVLHFGFTHYDGVFSNVSGTLTLDAKNPSASKLSVTIPVDSVQTTSAKLTEELKGDQWFDAAKFPNATFVSTSVRATGRNDAIVTGTLTLHGVTKSETLRVHFIGAGVNPLDKKYTAGFEATATIKRSDFGVKMYVPYVSDDVQLRIAGAFEQRT